MSTNQARERVLNTAEQLFHKRGYNAVSMRDVADALQMRQASLYYHVPEGKEQLFVEITERGLQRHRNGLEAIIAEAKPDIESQLTAASQWFVQHAPIRLVSMLETDMPAISHENAQKLTYMAFECFFSPITILFEKAIENGEIRPSNPTQLAGHFLSMIDGISYVTTARHTSTPMDKLAEDMIDMLLNGIRSN